MQPILFPPAAEFERWRQSNRAIEALLEAREPSLAHAAQKVSGWSPLAHVAHLELANELCLRNLQSFARREGMLLQRDKQPSEQSVELLARGTLPRGQAKSPRMVVPPLDVELDMVRSWHADNVTVLADLARNPHLIETSALSIPHQVLGPLDAPQWLRFAVVHTRHHLAIAYEALVVLGAKPAELPPLPTL
jgi:hypothetical protein